MVRKDLNLKKKAGIDIFAVTAFLLLILFFGLAFVGDSEGSIFGPGKNGDSEIGLNVNKYDDKKNKNYLFYLEESVLGQEELVSNTIPSIEIGIKEKFEVIFTANEFTLQSGPFSQTFQNFKFSLDKEKNIEELLVYFDIEFITEEEELNLVLNIGEIKTLLTGLNSKNVPVSIKIDKDLEKLEEMILRIGLEEVPFFELFNSNKVKIKNFKILAKRIDKFDLLETYNFDVDLRNIEKIELELYIYCKEIKKNSELRTKINGKTLDFRKISCRNENMNKLLVELPVEYLKNGNNKILFETDKYFRFNLKINRHYFNKNYKYRFELNSFKKLLDVVMYGEFDEDFLDFKLNGKLYNLKKDEEKTITNDLNVGNNRLEILTKNVNIEKLIIEKILLK